MPLQSSCNRMKQLAMFIQIATIASLVVSTYWVVMKYPTTIAGDPSLRRG